MLVTGLSVNKNFKSKWASSTKCDKCFEIQQKCKTKFFTWSPAKSNAKILKMWQSTQNFATWPIFELQKWFSTFWKWQSKVSSKVAKRFNKSDRRMLQNSIGENFAKLSLEIVAKFGRECCKKQLISNICYEFSEQYQLGTILQNSNLNVVKTSTETSLFWGCLSKCRSRGFNLLMGGLRRSIGTTWCTS